MSGQFTISQLAKSAGIPTSTIRYYERVGLVEPEDYRLYSDESLKKLKFIRAAQATGFTLDDVKALLLDDSGGTPTCGNVRGLIEDRLTDTERRLKDLRHVRRVLKSALQQCEQQEKSDCCDVVAGLHRG